MSAVRSHERNTVAELLSLGLLLLGALLPAASVGGRAMLDLVHRAVSCGLMTKVSSIHSSSLPHTGAPALPNRPLRPGGEAVVNGATLKKSPCPPFCATDCIFRRSAPSTTRLVWCAHAPPAAAAPSHAHQTHLQRMLFVAPRRAAFAHARHRPPPSPPSCPYVPSRCGRAARAASPPASPPGCGVHEGEYERGAADRKSAAFGSGPTGCRAVADRTELLVVTFVPLCWWCSAGRLLLLLLQGTRTLSPSGWLSVGWFGIR